MAKITSWYIKKINYLKVVSCVTSSILKLPCLFGNKEGTQLQMKKKVIKFSDVISGTNSLDIKI